MTLIAELATVVEEAVSRPLPPAAVEAAKSRLLHALGVGLASRDLPAVRVAWDAVSDTTGGCVAVGRPTRVPDRGAAFYNGVAGHSSLLEDCGPGGLREGSHPGTYVIPAALAAAESGRAGGRRLLLGIVAGYEAVSRLGAAAPEEIVARRFRPIAVMGRLQGKWRTKVQPLRRYLSHQLHRGSGEYSARSASGIILLSISASRAFSYCSLVRSSSA